MVTICNVLSKYHQLCNYCNSFWNSVISRFPDQINCKAGCSSCCELQSVVAIEAFNIISNISKLNKSSSQDKGEHSVCVFLANNICAIYDYRPVICRTHGLVLGTNENNFHSCPINYQHNAIPDDSAIIDWESLTMNMMKLNLAFCILGGFESLSSERFLLKDIQSGHIPPQFSSLLEAL